MKHSHNTFIDKSNIILMYYIIIIFTHYESLFTIFSVELDLLRTNFSPNLQKGNIVICTYIGVLLSAKVRKITSETN